MLLDYLYEDEVYSETNQVTIQFDSDEYYSLDGAVPGFTFYHGVYHFVTVRAYFQKSRFNLLYRCDKVNSISVSIQIFLHSILLFSCLRCTDYSNFTSKQ